MEGVSSEVGEVTMINKKKARFNLMVPLVQQRGPCSLKKLISNC